MKRNLLAHIAYVLFTLLVCAAPASAQITVTYTFTNFTTADPDQVNTNFSAIAAAALNRTGGTITGNITVSGGITIDGIDIGAVLGGTGTPTFAGVTITGTGASALDVGGGINAGTGNVGIIGTDGRIPAISSTFFASLSGANLTALTAANLSGSVPTANGGLGASFSSTAQGNTLYFSGTGAVSALAPGTAGMFLRTGGAAANPSWSNDGSNLTNLNAANLGSGTVGNSFIVGTYTQPVTFSSGSNSFTGIHISADGTSGITGTCAGTNINIVFKNGLATSFTCGA